MGSQRKEKSSEKSGGTEKKKKHKKTKIKTNEVSDAELKNNLKREKIKVEESLDVEHNLEKNSLELIKEELQVEHIDHEDNERISMPEEDLSELFNKMEQILPEQDTMSYSTRVEKLKWEDVAFKNYSASDCKKTWLLVQKRVRRFRILKELLNDAKEWLSKPWTNFYRGNKMNRHPNMPRKPLSSYMIFYKKKRNKFMKENPGMDITEVTKLIAQMYKSISPEKREKYIRLAAEERKKYEEKLEEFYNQHPEIPRVVEKSSHKSAAQGPKRPLTPFLLFFQSQVKNMASEDIDKATLKEQCRELWKNFSDKKKLVWIELALQQEAKYLKDLKSYKEMNPDFELPPHKSILTKEEKALKERLLDGKPVKPPNSAYSLFSTKMLQSEEIKSCPLKDRMNYISGLWKNMSEDEKKEYVDQTKQLIEKYNADYASYIKTLPKEKRQEELRTLSKRKQKSIVDEDHIPKKKRKEKIRKEEVKEEVKKSENSDAESEVEKSLMMKIFAMEPEHPPLNAFDLFCKNYTGSNAVKEEFNKLNKSEKRKLEKQVQNLKKAYIKDYEEFLNSLTKKQLKAFSKWSRMRDENKRPTNNDKIQLEESSSSDSESDSSNSS